MGKVRGVREVRKVRKVREVRRVRLSNSLALQDSFDLSHVSHGLEPTITSP